jgi:hypothetical protein
MPMIIRHVKLIPDTSKSAINYCLTLNRESLVQDTVTVSKNCCLFHLSVQAWALCYG